MRTMMKPIFQSQPTKMMRLLANRIIIRYSSPFWGVGVGNLAQVNVVQEIVHRHPVSVGGKGSTPYKIESSWIEVFLGFLAVISEYHYIDTNVWGLTS